MSSKLIKERCVKIGEYIKDNSATVRKTAEKFALSKSTVYKDASEKLKGHDPGLYKEVRIILDKNKAERHLRGGEATKRKYLRGQSCTDKQR
ncbi:MAG: sporulation transcriptional regulator SpoIIID [Clostridia bacterium]|nr:sporulation transcriptional regulator SpoIIID [Clostridia bacterium]